MTGRGSWHVRPDRLVGWLVGRSDVKNLGLGHGLLAGWMDGWPFSIGVDDDDDDVLLL